MYKIINDEITKDGRMITCQEVLKTELTDTGEVIEPQIRCFTFQVDKSNEYILNSIKELYAIYDKSKEITIDVKNKLTDTEFEVL